MGTYLIQDSTLAGIADAIRGKTGGVDPITVPDMSALIAGIASGGLPAGIAEYEVQTFTPKADTNDPITFDLNMQEMPTNIMIATEYPSFIARSFIAYYSGFPVEDSANDGTIIMKGDIKYYTYSILEYTGAAPNSSATHRTGVWNLTNKGFTFRSNFYGGEYIYFRAGYTYTIAALRMVTL